MELLDIHANNIRDLTCKLVRQKDEFIFAQFERHGYDKQDIFELAYTGRIQALQADNVIAGIVTTEYAIDHKPLFRIIERMGFTNITIEVEDISQPIYSREKNN